MKLLIITQKVDKDDSYFGFFHSWLEEFSHNVEKVTVIALERRAYDLPPNVEVLSLGKESAVSRVRYVSRLVWFAIAKRREYDVVFCHMSPLYVIVGAPFWKVMGKKVGLWYIHRNVDLKLKIAEKLTDVVFTASPESFRIRSRKVHYMRQAVDARAFARPEHMPLQERPSLALVTVGRLTPIKNLDRMLQAISSVRAGSIDVVLRLVGAAVTKEDIACAEALYKEAETLKLGTAAVFAGSVPFREIARQYWESDASINGCPTGGMDKAVLESLAASTPVFFSNKAFLPLFKDYEDIFFFPERDAEVLAKKLTAYAGRTDRTKIAAELMGRVRREYSLEALVRAIVSELAK